MQHGRAIVLTGHVHARNGSNSNRLQTDAESKSSAFLIAGLMELDLDVLRGVTIGLTAGASALAVTALPGIAENVEFKLPAGLND